MTEPSDERRLDEAGPLVAALDARAADLRAELQKLRKQLHDVKGDLSVSQAAALQEANQKLVLAVLHADSIAEIAVAELAAATYSHQHHGSTGIPNRVLGLDRLNDAIDLARRNGTQLAVLFLDLDDFKTINGHLGDTSGDLVLQLVTKRLQSVLHDGDTVSRYGGDEFLVVLHDVADAAEAGRVAGELLAALIMPGNLGGHGLQQSASLGISVYPDDGEDAATLVNRGGAAMFRCKHRGTGGFQFYAEPEGEGGQGDSLPGQSPLSLTAPIDLPADATSRQLDLREANEQLVLTSLVAKESETQARNAHRQQLTFMAMVAHELRNPLTPLRLATEMLTNRSVGDKMPIDRLAAIITTQLARMTRLVDDLLDGSRLSTGKLRLEFGVVDLVDVLEHVITACRPGIEARQQHFSVELPPGPLNLRGDPVRLAQIFNNLLDNARKYSPEGGEIALRMTVAENAVAVSVRDNGVGIAVEMLPLVFELFVQDAHALAHASGGLGIGLAVVHDLVDAHGGTVVGHSAGRDLGSEFVVTLPLS